MITRNISTVRCLILATSFIVGRIGGELAYGPQQIGPCRGPGGVNDKVNGRFAIEHTIEKCQTACDDTFDCIGYAYCSVCNGGECILYGAGLDGTCSDPSANNRVDCEALGSCSDITKLSEDKCGSCSEPTAPSTVTCQAVGGEWTAKVWTRDGAVWEGPEDPWTGDSHYSALIAGTTDEVASKYICVDRHAEDHLATCEGNSPDCSFTGVGEDDRIETTCPHFCTFTAAPKPPKAKAPHAGDINLSGWNPSMSGACRGGPTFTDKPNGKYAPALSQYDCAMACLAEDTCLGYSHASAWCVVYGPNIHETPGEGWSSDNHEAIEITGTKANISYICVTGPPRAVTNTDPNDPSGAQNMCILAARLVVTCLSAILLLSLW